MNIYTKKQKWKLALIGFAIAIGASSLFVTNQLVKKVKNQERKKMEVWAEALKRISQGGWDEDDIKIISDNKEIPVLLVAGECDTILEDRNLTESIILKRNKEKENLQNQLIFKNNLRDTQFNKIDSINNLIILTKSNLKKIEYSCKLYLKNELKIMRNKGDSIQINITDDFGAIYDTQRIYYKDSDLLYRLRYYPFYQLAFISVFMLIAYLAFSASKKAEQNQVWAGMAKETAHQIGTPLSSLMAWTELLKGKEGVQDLVLKMQKDINRLETITDRFSKIGSKPELVNENIIEIIHESVKYLKSRLPQKITFKVDAPMNQKHFVLPVSKVLLEWVIENICKNAVDSMKGVGLIKINIFYDNAEVRIYITDTGKGIKKNILNSIFEPGVTSKKRGWGLGLSLSKRIIEEYHNGKIFVENSDKKNGTTFCILLKKGM